MENVMSLVSEFKELNLIEHYNYESTLDSTISDSEKAIALLQDTQLLKFKFGDAVCLLMSNSQTQK